MDTFIGKNIAQLRRDRGVTQEALAAEVGVSGQAVSKWESGGSPDIELLPAIADYFEVSIDCLFGRDAMERIDINEAMLKPLYDAADDKERLAAMADYFWRAQRVHVCGGGVDRFKADTIEKAFEEDFNSSYICSEVASDAGITHIRITESRRYFLLMPKPKNGWNFKFDVKYTRFFADMADEVFLKALFFFYRREAKPFTAGLVERELGLNAEDAQNLLDRLRGYELIVGSELELDDGIVRYYNFNTRSVFIPFLALAEEMMERCANWYGYNSSESVKWLA